MKFHWFYKGGTLKNASRPMVFSGIVLPLEGFRVRQWIFSSENGFWRLRRLAPEAKIIDFHWLFEVLRLEKSEGGRKGERRGTKVPGGRRGPGGRII